MLNLKLFFLLLFIIYPLDGKGEWIKLFQGKGTIFYFDYNSLLINNEFREVKMMIDYKEKDSKGDLSLIIKRKINCNEMMYKDLETNFFKLNFGKGEKSRGSGQVENPKWKYFPPGSSGGEIIKVICRIKQSK